MQIVSKESVAMALSYQFVSDYMLVTLAAISGVCFGMMGVLFKIE